MKQILFLTAFTCIAVFSMAQSKTDTIKVWGNCESCKAKIEKAAKAAGATAAEWNDETLLLVVSYDAAKTSNIDIQKKVASVGYDTQDFKAADSSYKKLDKCCQYKRPESKGQSASNDTMKKCMNADNCSMDKCKKEDMECCKKAAGSDCCKDGKCDKG